MDFLEIIGQKRVVSILSRSIRNKRVPHALLFQGSSGIGKVAMAIAMAKAMMCQQAELYCDACSDCKRITQLSHPDLIVIFPSPKNPKVEDLKTIRASITKNPYLRTELWAKPFILIDIIRSLKKTIAMSSYENKGRVILILDAHRMTEEAGNSLLKILEEPPQKVTIILITDKPNLLFPTIISRCQQVKFNPLPWQEIEAALINRDGVEAERANLIARMSFGSYRRGLELLEENIETKQELLIEILRKVILSDLDILLMVESLVAQVDLQTIKEILVMMAVWFRDSMILESLDEEVDIQQKVVNIDRLDTMKKFVDSLEAMDYEKVLQKIERALELIDRNVYLNLTLIQLMYELKQLMRRKKNV